MAGETLLGACEPLRVASVALERLDQLAEIPGFHKPLSDPLLLKRAKAGDTLLEDVAQHAVPGFFQTN